MGMGTKSKAEVLRQISEVGVIPIVRAESTEMARRAITAICKGGVSIIEVTMTVPNAIRMIEELRGEVGPDTILGAGTVLDARTARKCLQAGAQFIVSPSLNVETIAFCNAEGLAILPGALTPTEIVAAWTAGADFVKVFPAEAMGGASYLKALKAPLPQIKMVPTGGVSLKTAAAFIEAGAEALGVGSDLVDMSALREGQDARITERAQQFIEIVKQARNSKKSVPASSVSSGGR
ncbi:MAG TPA: bifunctional 4-hydroxy-2-oxoglutarate aldolase/2-dehydro-3-deoxy-phosphogluconate aldolase [Candidatus Dormibacteraeota bacterium]|nr:bifunctional 4-hydroxy-2-oxoglutarate aldolase/2-dehydro-3-deoxy-phosphogluconate aldolase [Candidatus Dormibacteraeota bacterium]